MSATFKPMPYDESFDEFVLRKQREEQLARQEAKARAEDLYRQKTSGLNDLIARFPIYQMPESFDERPSTKAKQTQIPNNKLLLLCN